MLPRSNFLSYYFVSPFIYGKLQSHLQSQLINLERSPERRDMMISQMKKYNITNFTFAPTIDGKYLDKDKLKENNEWAYPGNKLCNNTCSCRGKGHNLSAGQISLHINHYNIWQDMVKNTYKFFFSLHPNIFASLQIC